MIDKTRIYISNTLDPWYNLAVEEALLEQVQPNECILYLWQNQNTVVIGRNQNPWRECRTQLLEQEGGKLARRLSGGGAVYHDLGNLNFTFLVDRKAYNVTKQVEVILQAVQQLGIHAVMQGRNDLTVEGQKFSGNAFYFSKESAFHHGTLLVSADIQKLGRYLQVSKEKMQSKGVQSVQSRVTNLNAYHPTLSISTVKESLITAFRKKYHSTAEICDPSVDLDSQHLHELYSKYACWDWRYGTTIDFDITLENRWSWGNIEIGLQVVDGKINETTVYSDALDEALIRKLPNHFTGCTLNSSMLADSLETLRSGGENKQLIEDLQHWLMSTNL